MARRKEDLLGNTEQFAKNTFWRQRKINVKREIAFGSRLTNCGKSKFEKESKKVS